MALYNNRQVTVVSPSTPAVAPMAVTVRYPDGTHENVPMTKIQVTAEEKKDLIKKFPSNFEELTVIENETKEVKKTK